MARVLLIDDVDVVRLVVRKMLVRAGHLVEEVGDGASGLARLRQGGIDLLVTDIWMPGAGGIALIQSARRQQPTLPILAISGGAPRYPVHHTLEEARAMGADAVLMKPVDRAELEQALAQLLARQGSAPAAPESFS